MMKQIRAVLTLTILLAFVAAFVIHSQCLADSNHKVFDVRVSDEGLIRLVTKQRFSHLGRWGFYDRQGRQVAYIGGDNP